VIFQSFKSLLTHSSHVKFGFPLSLLSLLVCLITPLWIGASIGLCWIWPNYLKWCCISFSSIGVTPNLSRMSSFQTRSLLMLPQIHHSMCISTTLSYWICRLLIGQHSAPYNMTGCLKKKQISKSIKLWQTLQNSILWYNLCQSRCFSIFLIEIGKFLHILSDSRKSNKDWNKDA
jgi:hypothetical protein